MATHGLDFLSLQFPDMLGCRPVGVFETRDEDTGLQAGRDASATHRIRLPLSGKFAIEGNRSRGRQALPGGVHQA